MVISCGVRKMRADDADTVLYLRRDGKANNIHGECDQNVSCCYPSTYQPALFDIKRGFQLGLKMMAIEGKVLRICGSRKFLGNGSGLGRILTRPICLSVI